MELNLELFERLKQKIREDSFLFSISESARETPCGTVACIAGHTYLLTHPPGSINLKHYWKYWSLIRDEAGQALGIPLGKGDRHQDQTGARLFFLEYWKEPYRSQYLEKMMAIREILDPCCGYWLVSNDPTESFDSVVYHADLIQRAIADPEVLKLKQEAAEIACARIDYFIATNGYG